MYKGLAKRLEHPSPTQLMDETLAVNFCPFRSPSWERLVNRAQSVAFSVELWSAMLDILEPPVVICLGETATRHLAAAMESQGWRQRQAPEVRPVHWGPQTYALSWYDSPHGRTLLVRLPHLSRFRIFGRPASRPAVEQLTSAITTGLAEQ